MSQNVVNFDFQGVVDLFIHEISGDWSQIMSKLDFSSEISTTSAIYDWPQIIAKLSLNSSSAGLS